MIYKLRNRFIKISVISLAVGLVLIYCSITCASIISLDRTVDVLTETIAMNDGAMPDIFNDVSPEKPDEPKKDMPQKMNDNKFLPEAKFTTRYFTVRYNTDNECIGVDTNQISSVDDDGAREYADSVLNKSKGWIDNYRYIVLSDSQGKTIVFVDAGINVSSTKSFLISTAVVLLISGGVIVVLICVFSKKAVRPVVESYEKQKQFITDANHELKTPLTLILANLDIAEEELGKNEWLDDIRDEGEQMTELVNRLVFLSRMDEDSNKPEMKEFNISESALDVISDYVLPAKHKNKTLSYNIDENIIYNGNEELIRKLFSLLLDNALKYCDNNGDIEFSLIKQKQLIISVENTFKNVDETELIKLFDRFYRSDKARMSGEGYGIGLSSAKAIVEKHKGKITAYKKDSKTIGFKVVL